MHYFKNILEYFFSHWKDRKKKKKILKAIGEKIHANLPLGGKRGYNLQGINSGKIQGIIVTQSGRFGNQLAQITHALYCAEKLGVKIIYLKWNRSFIQEKKRYALKNITITFNEGNMQGKCCIIGKFLFFDRGHLKNPIPIDDFLRINTMIFNCLLPEAFKTNTFPVNNNDLVIHIRSGDIFKGYSRACMYGQPPLAYYLTVLSIAKPSRVILVYEDMGNPCIESLQRYLDEKNISYVNFCRDFRETVSLLLYAKNICSGRGTFVRQIIFLSQEKKRTGYTYGSNDSRMNAKVAKIYYIQEKNEDYQENVLKEWKNTDEQRIKMIEYTEENFEITVVEN